MSVTPLDHRTVTDGGTDAGDLASRNLFEKSSDEDDKKTEMILEASPRIVYREKLRIWKNVIGICLSFVCLFTAFRVATGLASSVNAAAGLGAASQATIYVCQILSSMFVPTLMIRKMNVKWTMVVCQICYSTYIAAQFYPTFGTFIPTAILVGVGAAPLWCAKSTYLTQAGVRYAKLLDQESSTEPAITRLFGFFFMTFQTSAIWGNLISSTILSRSPTNATNDDFSDERFSFCGANFCNEDLSNLTGRTTLSSAPILPPQSQIDMLFGILMGFSLLAAVFIILLVDSAKDSDREEILSQYSGWKMLIATFHHAKHPYQMLIIPLTVWSGISQAFIAAEFNSAFIACSWGVGYIGYVMMCAGAAGAVSSMGCGYIVKLTGRIPIFLTGSTINFCVILAMLYVWSPSPHHPEVFFIVAGLWGLANAVWNTQLNAFYGVLFPDHKEPAFSNFRLWQSLGFAVAWAYSKFLCVDVKLYILLAVLLSGILGYLVIEVKERMRQRQLRINHNIH